MAIKCIGFITDPHIPHHDSKALSCALSALHDTGISELFLGGDIADMYWCHDHGPKDPRVFNGFENEAQEVNKFLDLIDKHFLAIPKHYIEGNHEQRFERFLLKNCPQLFGITEIKNIFNLHKRYNWKFYPYVTGQLVQVQKTNLFLKHAPKGSSGMQILKSSGCNLGFGHIHRIIDERMNTVDGRRIHVWSPGWLGNQKFDKVFGYVPSHHNWQQGFARIWYDDESWEFWVDIHEIKDGKCIVDNKMYKG